MQKQLLFLIITIFNLQFINSQDQKGQDITGVAAWNQLGGTTAISADGNRIVLGAPRFEGDGQFYGHVKVYDYNGSTWVQVGNEIKGSHNYNGVGARVSISADGNIIAFKAENSLNGPNTLSNKADVFVYELIGDNWVQKGQKLTENDFSDLFGNAISLSDNGMTLAIGADHRATGASGNPYVEVYRYNNSTNTWAQLGATLEGSVDSAFGGAVSLSKDGNTLAVGAPNSNTTRVYQLTDDTAPTWSVLGQQLYGESGAGYLFGSSVALSDDGRTLAVGDHTNNGNGNSSGHVRVFEYSATNGWLQKGSDMDGENIGDISGASISLSSDGNIVAIGAYRNDANGDQSGHVRIYKFEDDWQQSLLDIDGDAAEDEFGFSVSLSGDGNTVLIGARNNDSNGTNAGLARVFSLNLVEEINTVEGYLFYNENRDACLTEVPIQNALVTLTTNGSTYCTNTNTLGYYTFTIENKGSYTVSIDDELPDNLVIPETETGTFDSFENTHTINFCIEGPDYYDLSIIFLPINEARPGFVSQNDIVYTNNGTTEISGEITLEFDQNTINGHRALPNYDLIETNKMTWTFSNLQPYESRVIWADFEIAAPPTVNGDDILTYTATITNSNTDANPLDNTYVLEQLVVNSFDPNDKRVKQGETFYEEEVGEYLEYMVRFQNTGTASAINVVLKDTLDPNLNWDSFKMIAASHEYKLKIVDGNKIDFIFDNIHLPDSTSNERESNGYVSFKVKPKSTLTVGDSIKGKADIYFDFNLPIETNVVSTKVIERPEPVAPIKEKILEHIFAIYPIPVIDDKLYVKLDNTRNKIYKSSFITLSGKEISITPVSINRNEFIFDTSSIFLKVFFLKLTTDQGVHIEKIVK
ncbi:DUF7619 domain-containing protein [Aquimarina intermedia]|uniref:Putative repeat protein (TIGR01451 family) n=1 Tax=Aquimarina intermedia TaxID=350814 RepID=A0A5S5BUS4_9FLAO|nr:hypothetical protein [Aquimarina intermedia]TYP69910.1 putative repeat protein (TIGR01451 family) [Aquimarina intermedia]